MDIVVTTDLAHMARDLGLPVDQVQRTVELLDEGNTVPFITRYRKDQTGGFDEEQIRRIRTAVTKARMLAERKQTILKSIESQGKLDKDLIGQIKSAQSTKRLEDLYLPYKPKKQTLATVARQRGLQPLADEVLTASPLAADLDLRTGDYLNPDAGLFARADVLLGVGHLLAETFSERADLRSKLRRILRNTGRLVSTRATPAEESVPQGASPPASQDTPAAKSAGKTASPPKESAAKSPKADESAPGAADDSQSPKNATPPPDATQPADADQAALPPTAVADGTSPPAETPTGGSPTESSDTIPPDQPSNSEAASESVTQAEPEKTAEPPSANEDGGANSTAPDASASENPEPSAEPPSEVASNDSAAPADASDTSPADNASSEPAAATEEQTSPQPEQAAQQPETASGQEPAASGQEQDAPSQVSGEAPSEEPADAKVEESKLSEKTDPTVPSVAKVVAPPADKAKAEKVKKEKKKKSKKEKDREKKEKAFKDYFDFKEDLSRLLPHRILAINRGERAKILKVRIESDTEQMVREAEKLLIAPEHPHAEFLRGVVRDALTRLVWPGLEREIRRELTEKAEAHAVEVFARNLRHLLLTPPLHGHRVLAIDPGFRSGCKMAALDEFGNVLGHGVIHFVGREERKRKARYRLIEMIRLHRLSVVAIGNGTACRDVEQLVADVIAYELKDLDVAYCVVNEAGASVYSTSGLGREELPDYDATLRSAISIGRRLLDPLSELVKINPSNIGVGLYQHDVKAKHLRESLDAVVESCVNYVGVDVNTASPALLRYVSGLNQLTARRLYDYRLQHGPFKNREQLKDVPGFGAATFVQAAGFLKISNGDNPLDATWIHPESYDVSRRVLERLNSSVSDLSVGDEPSATSTPIGATTELASAAADPVAAGHEGGPAMQPTVVGDAVTIVVEPAVIIEPAAAAAEPAPVEETAGAGAPASDGTSETPTGPDAVPGETEAAADVAEPPAGESSEEAVADTAAGAARPDEERTAAEPTAVEPPTEAAVSEAVQPPTADAAGDAAEHISTRAQDAVDQQTPPSPPPSQKPAVAAPSTVALATRIADVDVDAFTVELGIGKLLLKDILASLARPMRDPREGLPRPIFRRGIVKIDDLEAGMALEGTVLNVVDFGVFVDIGLNDSALIHVSRLADRYVRDPHDVVSVGDIIKVWVVDVDKKRRRVSLTAIKPGTERKPAERRGRRDRDKKKGAQPPRGGAAGKKPAQGRGAKPAGGRGRQTRPRAKPQYKPKPKPKPVVPITKAMKEGKEPMRTFSDLQQFFQLQKDKPEEKKPSDNAAKEPEEKKTDSEKDAT